MSKKIGLTCYERFVLFEDGFLPEKGNIVTMRPLNVLRRKLSLTDTELKKFGVTPRQEGGLSLDLKKDKERLAEVDFNFEDVELSIVIAALKKLNDSNAIAQKHISLYDKFIGIETTIEGKGN